MKEIKKQVEGYNTLRTLVIKNCEECDKEIEVLKSELKRGGGKFCNRVCYYNNLKKTRPSGEESWAWKGDEVGKEALHNWVQKNRGKPKECEHCKTTEAKQYDWANVSGKYKRELEDFIRLCRSCHAKYDYPERSKKWKKSVEKLGWNVTKIK